MQSLRLFAPAALALALALPTAVPAADATYTPQVGQEGKDVIWVPTPEALIAKMLDMAKLTPNDIVFDLGSGDGRTVIAAAKRGAKATGIEFNPDMVNLSRASAQKAGVADKATFINGDIFATDFSQATVLTMYLLPSLNLRLRPTILNMKPGTRVVSHAFTMDDWKADETASVDGRTAYHWIVPAKVEGVWQLGQGELALKQNFQMVTGTIKTGGTSAEIVNGRLRGDQLSFNANGVEYTGRVAGNSIDGTAVGGAGGKWVATRGSDIRVASSDLSPKPTVVDLQVGFAFASAQLNPEARAALDAFATSLSAPAMQNVRLRIVGHTDSRGADNYNLKLSKRRAQSVATYLVSQHRIDAGRLTVDGIGSAQPLDGKNPTSAVNRRVQIMNANP
jgi:outer membrane protein OmpA-like peptidoglycan-associated protein/precorrin-6B methylase 2